MKYSVTYYIEHYAQSYKNIATDPENIKTFPIRKSIDCVEGETKEQCFEFIKDFLDVAETPLTLEDIKNDFGIDISNNNAEKILRFYNGRFDFYHKILHDIELHLLENPKIDLELKYNLPEEINSFSFEDDQHYQLNSYILICSKNV